MNNEYGYHESRVELLGFLLLIIVYPFSFVNVRNTRSFVLYFSMKEYTSVPYIEGISVRYK